MQAEKFPFETVKVADKDTPSWMAAFDASIMPQLSDIGKTANLPVLHDRSFARTAIAMGDTQKGAFQVLVDGVDANKAERDPRVAQLRRMMAKDVEGLAFKENTKTLALMPPAEGKEKPSLGSVLEKPANDPSGAVLSSFALKEMKQRANGLPQHLKGRMKALEQTIEGVRAARRSGKIGEGAALAAVADVSEKAFLVAEGGKSDKLRKEEARTGKVDSLFAVAATATRAASREKEGKKFARGLVSDVMASDQTDRLNGERGLRKGDDFASTAKRLRRLGLVGKDDPRLEVDDQPVKALMGEKKEVKDAFEKRAVEDVTPSQGNIEAALSERRKKEEKPEREKPPESVAPTTYQQVGLSGKYLAAEISRDNENAAQDRERAAQLRKKHAEASKNEKDFARAGYAEMAMMDSHRAGRDKSKTRMAGMATAVRANTGVKQVSQELARQPIQKQKSRAKVAVKQAQR